jgi:hypothetical protein
MMTMPGAVVFCVADTTQTVQRWRLSWTFIGSVEPLNLLMLFQATGIGLSFLSSPCCIAACLPPFACLLSCLTIFSRSSFLAKAADLINYAFEKSDAQEKYGSENIFSAITGGRSLRYTAELIYQTSVSGQRFELSSARAALEAEISKATNNLLKEVYAQKSQSTKSQKAVLENHKAIFDKVGGASPWLKFFDSCKDP